MAARADLARSPRNYCRVQTKNGSLLLAYGRDPYFEGWPDTLQLNYGNPQLQQAMIGELERIAGQCDGVRCDMAMLVLPDVFESTWGIRAELFWPKATESVRRKHPNSSSWPRSTGIGNGRCCNRDSITPTTNGCTIVCAKVMRGRCASIFTRGSIIKTSSPAFWKTTTSRGRRQRSRWRCMKLRRSLRSCHLGCVSSTRDNSRVEKTHLSASGSGPEEPIDQQLEQFYDRLLGRAAPAGRPRRPVAIARMRPCLGWQLDLGLFLGFCLARPDGERLLVTVNYAPNQSQCYVRLPFTDLVNGQWRLEDLIGDATYDREGNDLQTRGLYLDEPPWQGACFLADENIK